MSPRPPSSTLFPYTTLFRSDNVLRMPGFLTKNKEPYSLALTDENDEPYAETAFMVNMKVRHSHPRSEEHTSELQSHVNLVCRLLLEKKKMDHERSHASRIRG